MGFYLSYRTVDPIDKGTLSVIRRFVAEKNNEYEWWSDSLKIGDDVDESGKAFGYTQLFRDIDDPDVDNYMTYLDGKEIVDFFCQVSKETGTSWELEIEGGQFGRVEDGKIDADLQHSLQLVLGLFSGNTDALKKMHRKEILSKWKDQ